MSTQAFAPPVFWGSLRTCLATVELRHNTKKQSIDAVINCTSEKEQFAESITRLSDTPGIAGKLAA